jgi:hypothetical protein
LIDAIMATGYSGPVGNRPASSGGSPGKLARFWYATDDHTVYFDTGSSWVALTSYASGTQAALPAASRLGGLYWATDTSQLYIGVSGGWSVVNPRPQVTMLTSTGDTSLLGSGYQPVPGLSGVVFMSQDQVAVLDAGVMLEHATGNDGVMAFWAVGGTGGAMLTGAARAAGTLAGVNGSARLQAPAAAFYEAPADGFYTFAVYATNQAGGGYARGGGGVSWGRIAVH